MGPMYAAVTIATAGGDGAERPQGVLDAAVAAESVGVLPELLTMLVDQARSKSLRVNNVLAVLTGDFAATHALSAAARLSTPAVVALSRAGQRGCEGGMRDAVSRFDPYRSVEDWFLAASETAGAATVLATELGMIVRGEEGALADPLHEFGTQLGIAIRLAEEIVELTVGNDPRPGKQAADLGRGIYGLPVLYAIEAEQQLPRMLARYTAEGDDPAPIVAAVRESGGLDRAIAECSRRGDAARQVAEGLPGPTGELLAALAAAPAEHLARSVAPQGSEAVGAPVAG